MKELMCKKCNGGDCGGKPILCDEDVVSVTCGSCSMKDVTDAIYKQLMGACQEMEELVKLFDEAKLVHELVGSMSDEELELMIESLSNGQIGVA